MLQYIQQVILHLNQAYSAAIVKAHSILGYSADLPRVISAQRKAFTKMATKLFVGKLSFNTTDDSLLALFAEYGKVVSARVATDRDTNRSKGFGFVEMENQEDAQKAINALDGKSFEDRIIVVNVARPKEDHSQNRGGFRGGFQRR